MSDAKQISRRTVLRGLGTALALPFLDAMLPARGVARGAFAGEVATRYPLRVAFAYVPNGIHMEDWTPERLGADFELPPTLAPLEPYRKELLVLSGLTQDKARPNGDGPGDHARAASAFLTGVQPLKTAGANIRSGVSVDQVAAARVGPLTRLPSLELGCDRGPQAGNCDSGYSCAYSANISWKGPSTPMAKEIDPRLVFERLFPSASPTEAAESRGVRDRHRKSILDFVLEDARRLEGKLGAADRRKLGEYLAAVREVEGRIERSEADSREGQARLPAIAPPEGIPRDYGEHQRLLYDILAFAFQADLSRVATFMVANEGSNKSYAPVGVPEGHHDLSHHGGNKEKQAKIAKINRFHMEGFAYFIAKLKGVREGDGTLLDHCMIVYGSGIGDGNRHNHDELPVVLLGRGGGSIETGRHVRYKRNTPLNNLYLCLLDRMDASVDALGDSTGRLPWLAEETRAL
ncbi:MAG: DUF1552 domain-containing protein [Planctomycetes bacterium]|nr:DUF1552 domain-containing protein [Planctomycetota bacterium]